MRNRLSMNYTSKNQRLFKIYLCDGPLKGVYVREIYFIAWQGNSFHTFIVDLAVF